MKKNPIDDQALDKGFSPLTINRYLKKKTEIDFRFKNSTILGSMCTSAPKIALKTFLRYQNVNLGDPGLFPGSAQLEKETITLLGKMLHNNQATGVFVTGGTEANILAIKTALLAFLDRFPKEKCPHREDLKFLVPLSAHFSFDKAATLLGVKIEKIPLDENYRIDLTSLEKTIDDKTFAIVGVAGTTGLGVIDPIAKMSQIALQKKIPLHVDAAFGGFVIPFLSSLFQEDYPFDFALDGVNSITIDPHKMGRGVTPGGVILYRDEKWAKYSYTTVNYLAGGKTTQLTMVGTRSGSAVIACYASFLSLGQRGYQKIVQKAIKTTDFLVSQLKTMKDYRLVTQPTINIVGIRSFTKSAPELASHLRKKGLAVACFEDYIRVVIMPHINKKGIRYFCKILKKIEKENQIEGKNDQ